MVDNSSMVNNFRSAVLEEPNLMPPGGSVMGTTSAVGNMIRTPFAGNVRALPPPLPQSPLQSSQYGGGGGYGSYGGYGGGFGGSGYGMFGGSGFGGYGGLSGLGGYGGYGGYGGFGSYGGGAYNRFGGMNGMDPEARFIQLAEASSRPAFQSIESLVSAIGNIASMLDSTFFALTSSFRAILGVAANFGRLRGVFSQFWQTFALFRTVTWIYKKILYWLRLSNLEPSSSAFKEAFSEAVNETSAQQSGAPKLPRKGQSPWPVLAFLSFIFTAPYLIMKLLGTVMNTAQEEARNPAKWVQPIKSEAMFDFQGRNPTELSMRAGDRALIAPKEIQNTLGLLNSGWAIATLDGQTAGIVPINYMKTPQQIRQEQQQLQQFETEYNQQQQQQHQQQLPITAPPVNVVEQLAKPLQAPVVPHQTVGQPELMNLSASAFASPPQNIEPDFDIAPQPIGPPAQMNGLA